MKTFTEYLNEGRGFELGGKKYSSGFGRYTCDGKSISKEEYMKASTQYKGGNVSSKSSENTNIVSYKNGSVKVSNHNIDFNIAYGDTITKVTGKALTFSNLPGYKFAIDKRSSRNDNDLYAITELHTGLSVGYVKAKKTNL